MPLLPQNTMENRLETSYPLQCTHNELELHSQPSNLVDLPHFELDPILDAQLPQNLPNAKFIVIAQRKKAFRKYQFESCSKG